MTETFRIAGYTRISVDDEIDRDNVSIENQKAIIEDFVKTQFPGSSLTFFEDRDRSGYTFEQLLEEQAKLGFRKEVIRLYYPVGMLNNLFGTACDAEEMQQALAGFTDFAKERLGEVTITHKKDRFCLLLPEETSIYVHEHKKENEFIHQLVNLIASHETDMEQVKKLFEQQPFPSVVEQTTGGEFDTVIHFTQGDDRYYYCFKDEGCHIIYHRFLPEDYADFDF